MEGITILITRLQKQGYRYRKGHFDMNNVPDSIANKSCYINTHPQSDGSNDLKLDSTSGVNTIREEFIVYLLDLQRNVNLNQFINDRNIMIKELLKNRGTDKISGVAKIEISNVRNGDTEKYLVSEIIIAFTEVLA
jgi:hypothetical protein